MNSLSTRLNKEMKELYLLNAIRREGGSVGSEALLHLVH